MYVVSFVLYFLIAKIQPFNALIKILSENEFTANRSQGVHNADMKINLNIT